ncbi:MAG: pilus (MSHA type) biogenesis protein MshL [Pseudomonadota bacterium]|nr:MAG: pilus (MSHA type) biogenesis protein MshL [Pseudomonadota bacterium]
MSRRIYQAVLLTGLLTAGLAACTATGERATEIDQSIRQALEEAAARQPPGVDETRDLLLPPLTGGSVDAPPEERFHVTVESAPARQFLMSLVAETDINMVVHPDVEQTISLELRNVTVPEVLRIVREVYGLEFQRTETGYLVRPPRLETRVYEVSYLDINRKGSSRTRVSSGQSTESPAALQDGLSGMSTSTPLAQPGAGGGDSDLSTGTRIETESESDFWSGLRDAIEGVFDSPDGRNVMVNPISGVVAVRAYPHEQRAIGELLDTIQGSVQRQVILEAKIVEVELHDAYRSGINWTALQDIDGRLASFGQIAGADIFDEGISSIRDRLLDVRPGNPFSGFDGEAFGGSSVIAIDTGDFNAFIELLETQGVTRVLSSPRVATINNQKAVIKVGTDEFFVTGVTGRTATGGTSTTAASSVQLTPFFSGIALDVTPQISSGGDIILHIHPTVSEVQDQTKSFTVAGQEETLPLAFSSVRQSDSIIRARNGQVVVIGGLMRESSIQDRFGTPILSRLPLIGQAFGSRRERTVKTELVILLRPIVIDSDDVWAEQADAPLERLRRMDHTAWPR